MACKIVVLPMLLGAGQDHMATVELERQFLEALEPADGYRLDHGCPPT